MSGSRHGVQEVTSLERAAVIVLLFVLVAVIFTLQMLSVHLKQTKKRNKLVRRRLFEKLGLESSSKERPVAGRRTIIGFFHPYCNAGGGGERVLWQAIEYHLRQDERAVVIVYSGDVDSSNCIEDGQNTSNTKQTLPDGASAASKDEILAKCFERFAIPLNREDYAARIQFLPLMNRILVSDKYWKRLTLLGQSYGAMRLAWESCSHILPDVWIDTMGYGFAYPVVKAFHRSIKVGAYVHYPMISTDMLRRVQERQAGHTNNQSVSASRWKSHAKLLYYRIFARAYAFSLRRADVLVANGSWTQNHVNTLISGHQHNNLAARKGQQKHAEIVYPPCDTGSMSKFPLEDRSKHSIISLAQFRPEKEHSTQIRIVAEIVKRCQETNMPVNDVHLTCAGSCRNEEDESRIKGLRELAKELAIEDHVSFVINAPYDKLLEHLRKSSVGLSTMVDEHFGINVVEFMAAGLITLSHASAGPLLDIAVPVDGQPTGFHAKTVPEFASALERIFTLGDAEVLAIRDRARRRATNVFSNRAFCESWEAHLWSPLIGSKDEKKRQ